MKTCPICSAIAFDDQEICFGCLHSFKKDELSAEVVGIAPNTHVTTDAASFLLSFVPHVEASGSINWTCTVEPVAASR